MIRQRARLERLAVGGDAVMKTKLPLVRTETEVISGQRSRRREPSRALRLPLVVSGIGTLDGIARRHAAVRRRSKSLSSSARPKRQSSGLAVSLKRVSESRSRSATAVVSEKSFGVVPPGRDGVAGEPALHRGGRPLWLSTSCHTKLYQSSYAGPASKRPPSWRPDPSNGAVSPPVTDTRPA